MHAHAERPDNSFTELERAVIESIELRNFKRIGRQVRWAWLAAVGIGILAAVLLPNGIDINLSADVEAVSVAMLDAELRFRDLADIALLIFVLVVVVSAGLYLLPKDSGQPLAGTSLVAKRFAAGLGLIEATFTMNSAEIASHPAYQVLADSSQRLLLNGTQATSTFTAFYLSLVLASSALAGFCWLFLRTGRIPRVYASWGLFATSSHLCLWKSVCVCQGAPRNIASPNPQE